MKHQRFVNLSVRSDMSIGDGAATIKSYCEHASARGDSAIAFAEDGTMRGCVDFASISDSLGLKAIFGVSVRVCGDMTRRGLTPDEKSALTASLNPSEYAVAIDRFEDERGIMDAHPLTLWARTQAGLKNLFKLTSLGWTKGFYYHPRVDIDCIVNHSDGVALGTGDHTSAINRLAIQGKRKRALSMADKLFDAFGPENFFVELQPHPLLQQSNANSFALTMLDRYAGARPLATQGARYISRGDAKFQKMVAAVTPGNKRELESCGMPGSSYWLKTRSEMFAAFRKHHNTVPVEIVKRALGNTVVLADSCVAKLKSDKLSFNLPKVFVPKRLSGNIQAYIQSLCVKGWAWRGVPERVRKHAKKKGIKPSEAKRVYVDRLKHELRALERQGFTPYILMTHELYAWTRGEGIAGGPGRGSAAGSLVNFLLGITAVDPIEYGLLFERFISPDRLDMPDIDMDFDDLRRQDVIDHLYEKYGRDCVSQIATIGRLKAKSAIRDTSRALGVPAFEVKETTDMVIERPSGDERADKCVEDSFRDFLTCQKFNKKHPEVLGYASHVEGMAKTVGVHAAGVICSPTPLADMCPMETRKNPGGGDRVVVTALTMKGAASRGLLKVDVLGLRTMSILKIAVDEVKRRHGVAIDLESIPVDDDVTLAGFTNHDYVGVFQYDSRSADRVCRGVTFDRFEDVIVMTALNRPGTSRSGLAEKFVKRKNDPKLAKKVDMHKSVSKITSDALGIIVYQEHVVRIFTDVAGFDTARADGLRSKIGKSVGAEALSKDKGDFVDGAVETTGMKRKTAEKLMDSIVHFGCLPSNALIDTPNGHVSMQDLRKGDPVLSYVSGRLVPNRVKRKMCSGTKEVFSIETDKGVIAASADHFWLLDNGSYAKTSELVPGSVISYAIGYEPQQAKGQTSAMHRGRVSSSTVRPGNLHVTLPAGLSERADGGGEPREFEAFNQPRRGHQLEARTHEGDLPRDRSSGSRSNGGEELRMEGWGDIEAQRDQEVIDRKTWGLRALWVDAAKEWCKKIYKRHVAPAPQKQEAFRQSTVECRTFVPDVPLERACQRATVRQITSSRTCKTWDVEVENKPHNYLVDGHVCHNSYSFNKSHATCYGLIAYWCMYMKKHWPMEFFLGSLMRQDDHGRLQSLIQAARDCGVKILPPNVSTSGVEFNIDDSVNAIRGSLVDIKGVGGMAATSIIANAPYKDLWDFLARVDRRVTNKRVVKSLAYAGAFGTMIPNLKYMIDRFDDLWDLIKKAGRVDKDSGDFSWVEEKQSKIDLVLRRSKVHADYSDEERTILASKVNPLAFGEHPIKIYKKFIREHVKHPVKPIGGAKFFEECDSKKTGGVFIVGLIVEIKFAHVGDYHTGPPPSEEEKPGLAWGKRFAYVSIEGSSGASVRCKLNWDGLEEHEAVVLAGVGTPVVALVSCFAKFESTRIHMIVDLEAYRKRVVASEKLGLWEKIVAGKHPTLVRKWKNANLKKLAYKNIEETKRRAAAAGDDTEIRVVGVVLSMRQKSDKNGKMMGFFHLLGVRGAIECLCFASNWKSIRKAIKPGNLISIGLDCNNTSGFYNGDSVRIIEARSPGKPVA